MLTSSIEFSSSGEEGKKRVKFGGTALSGAIIPNRNWDGSALEIDVPSMINFGADDTKRVFVLDSHNYTTRVGTATLRRVGAKVLLENGEFFQNTPDGLRVESELSAGGPFELSIGLLGVNKHYDKQGRKKRTLNGIEHEVGSQILNGDIIEVSLVVAGADRKTSVAKFCMNNGINFNQEGDHSVDLEKLTAEVAKLTAEKAAETQKTVDLTAERDVATKALAAFVAEKRTGQLTVLGVPAEGQAALLTLPDAAFAAVVSAMSTQKPAVAVVAPKASTKFEAPAPTTELDDATALALSLGLITTKKGA